MIRKNVPVGLRCLQICQTHCCMQHFNPSGSVITQPLLTGPHEFPSIRSYLSLIAISLSNPGINQYTGCRGGRCRECPSGGHIWISKQPVKRGITSFGRHRASQCVVINSGYVEHRSRCRYRHNWLDGNNDQETRPHWSSTLIVAPDNKGLSCKTDYFIIAFTTFAISVVF